MESELLMLLRLGKSHFEKQDFEGCLKVLEEVLHLEPGNPEAASLRRVAQKAWQARRLSEELEIRHENLKHEAMSLFDKEEYRKCVPLFRHLCEREPENHTFREYLHLSLQMASPARDASVKEGETAATADEIGDLDQREP